MEHSKTLFCSSTFPWVLERISSVYGKFWHAPSKRFASPGLVTIPTELLRLQTTILGFQKMCLPATHSVWSSDMLYSARFGFLTTLLMKFPIFFDMTPCKLTYWYRRFGGASCFQLQGSFGFLWNVVTYHNTRHEIPKACSLQPVEFDVSIRILWGAWM
jgi:hypothetical protein